MDADTAARCFDDIARLLEARGEPPYRPRAYRRAARSLREGGYDLSALASASRLTEVPGVGKDLAEKLMELLGTGRLDYYERLRGEFPPVIITLLDRSPDLDLRPAMHLWRQEHLDDPDALEAALRAAEPHVAQPPPAFPEPRRRAVPATHHPSAPSLTRPGLQAGGQEPPSPVATPDGAQPPPAVPVARSSSPRGGASRRGPAGGTETRPQPGLSQIHSISTGGVPGQPAAGASQIHSISTGADEGGSPPQAPLPAASPGAGRPAEGSQAGRTPDRASTKSIPYQPGGSGGKPAAGVTNGQIATIFFNISRLLDVRGGDSFRATAYGRAAREIQHLTLDLRVLAAEGRLRTLPGVGVEIERKLIELLETGRLDFYDRLLEEFPPGILELMRVPGLGPRLAAALWKELGITDLDGLEPALGDGRVATLPRMGEKAAANLLRSLEALRARTQERVLLSEGRAAAGAIVDALRERTGLPLIEVAGSIRRWQETVKDIDVVAASDDPAAVTAAFVALPQAHEVLSHGPQRASIRIHSGLQVDLLIKPPASYASLLQHFTGSKGHNVLLRERALHRGLSMSEYGLTDVKSGEVRTAPGEAELYAMLGLQYIPPELREGSDEIARAERNEVPRLVELGDIAGDLHTHTDWSDGRVPLPDMVQAARDRGYRYIAVTDHSSGRGWGLPPDRLREQLAMVRDLNRSLGGAFRILTGSEVDIRADGSLDYPDDLLAELDVVVASVHSAMGQDIATMTSRVVRALRNPHVDIFGHPTGRLIGTRDPIALDMEAVFQAALESGTMLEINASPNRLDLRDVHVRRAVELGIPLVCSSDAHQPDQFDQMVYGVATARRGWATSAGIVNTRPLEDLLAFLGAPKGRARSGRWGSSEAL